ncbi:MAG TPA: cupredoxin family copper-binding protein [Desulfosporosinus sp.]
MGSAVVAPPIAIAQSISIKGFAFSPAELTINKGDTVTWTNEDSATHTVVGGVLHSQDLANGQAFSFTFTEIGTYDYICTHHPSMKGKIIVK